VHAVVIEIEAQRSGVTDAQRQRRSRFGRVGEPDERLERGGAEAFRDVAQHASGGHVRQLPGVADQPHARAPVEGEGDDSVEVGGARRACFVHDQQRPVVD
jgi:hypothetical protein